jgi:hypothetical protein
MNFRSTHTHYTHFGGDITSNVESSVGVQLSLGTVKPAGDDSNLSITVTGKGTGGVQIGATSTSAQVLNQRYFVEFTVPAMSSASSAESTATVVGLTTNSAIFITPRLKLNSTVTGVFVTARCSTADELVVEIHNCSQSSLSGSTQSAYVFQIAF